MIERVLIKNKALLLSLLLFFHSIFLPALSHADNTGAASANDRTASVPKTVKTIIVDNYHPYTFINEKGEPDGFSVEIARAVTRTMDLKLVIRADKWDQAMKELEAGSIDLLPMMAYTPERAKTFNFSVPHTIAFDTIFLKKGSTSIRSFKDLTGKTVIVLNRDVAHSYLLSSGLSKTMSIKLVNSMPEALRQLADGRGDAAIMPKLVGIATLKRLNITNIDTSPLLIDAYTRPFSFAVKDGNQALLERLNQGLNIIKSTGQYDAIYNKWFGLLEDPHLYWKSGIKYLSAFALVMLGLVVWNILLKRQVKAKTAHLEQEIEEHKQSEETLRFQSEIMTHMDEAVYLVRIEDALIVYTNSIFEKMFGYGQGEMIGKHVSIVNAPAEKKPEETAKEIMDILNEKGSWQGEVNNIRKDGTSFWCYAKVSLFDHSKFGRVLVSVHTDITERKHLENQLRQAQKMEGIGQLAGGVAHDFNNILSVIIGYGHVALMKMAKDDPNRFNIEQMLDAGERAAQLTKDLLLFSRKQLSEQKPVDLNEIIRKVEKFLIRVIGEDIECRTTLFKGALPVLGDLHQLEQVLMNLATNARDAMPSGGIFAVTTDQILFDDEFISTHGYGKPGNYGLITISDTGLGMDGVTIQHIFEPFFTTKEVGKGTGLGLAVVYGIITQHEGFINVFSEPGQGTTFNIYLPLIGSFTDEKKKVLQELPARGTETVLLAEDDETVRNVTRIVLEDMGYTVIMAHDGQEAVNKFRENRDKVQLLLFDIIMPKKTGQEAYDEIRAISPDIKIMFQSGYAPDIVRKKVSLENGVTIVYKPVLPTELLKRVREALDRGE